MTVLLRVLAERNGRGPRRPPIDARWRVTAVAVLVALGACGGGSGDDAREIPAAMAAETSVDAPLVPVYRFANTVTGSHFYTSNEDEKSAILRDRRDMRFEGVAFSAYPIPQQGPGTGRAVYRFANLKTGAYFYTSDADERDAVLKSRPDMRFEGVSFGLAGADWGGAPVFRIANLQNGGYFYTRDAREAATAVATGFWRDEGVGFYEALNAEFPRALAYESLRGVRFATTRIDGSGAGGSPAIYDGPVSLRAAFSTVLQSQEDTTPIRWFFSDPMTRNAVFNGPGLPRFMLEPDYFTTRTVVAFDYVAIDSMQDRFRPIGLVEFSDRIELTVEVCSNRTSLNETIRGQMSGLFAIPKTSKPIVFRQVEYSPLPKFLPWNVGSCPG